MNVLIPYAGLPALIDSAPDPTASLLETDIGRLERALAEVNDLIADRMDHIREMNDDLEDMFQDTFDHMSELKAEHEALLSEVKIKEAQEAHARFQEQHKDDDWRDFSKEQMLSEPSRNEKSDNSVLKSLWRLIAMKTHPDRTDDPELHQLFLEAKTAFRKGDLDKLRDIHHILITGVSRLVWRLRERLHKLSQALAEAKQRSHQQVNSVDYRMAFDWLRAHSNNDTALADRVSQHYSNTLQVKIINLVLAINKLDPTRYVDRATALRQAIEEAKRQQQQVMRMQRISFHTTTSSTSNTTGGWTFISM